MSSSHNPDFNEVLDLHRRRLLQGAALQGVLGSSVLAGSAGAVSFLTPVAAQAKPGTSAPQPLFSFTSVPVTDADTITLPPGYHADVIFAWGDPLNGKAPTFKQDASNSADEQAQQCGMHNDGMHLFALPRHSKQGKAGLLCVNHEYTDDGLLHTDGFANWSAEKVRKAQAALGVSVVQVAQLGEGKTARWQVQSSPYARRITGYSPIRLSGPAAGHALLQTSFDPKAQLVQGTFANCANGFTPWGTYLTCEENFHGYFALNDGDKPNALQSRYGIGKGAGYRWHEFDPRFNASEHPNEANRFGWVVEIDPYNPHALPVKRTALGRFKHEGAAVRVAKNGQVVVYMGDDEKNEYIYKFVSKNRFSARSHAESGLLDEGTLYVAKFNADGSGQWLPLVHGQPSLTTQAGFADQAAVLVNARGAADVVGATKMDRPEWIAIHPQTGEVYVTLTNNNERGKKSTVDAANPRANNVYGHIVRWHEAQGDATATSFAWNVFLLAGDPQLDAAATIKGDAFGSPDGLAFDAQGTLWIQTDISTSTLGKKEYANLGNNMLLAADPRTGETRRFMVGPRGCEVTGFNFSADGCTMFINIQHPGESPSERSDPNNPKAISSWPNGAAGGRPRSATIAIRRDDGERIGK